MDAFEPDVIVTYESKINTDKYPFDMKLTFKVFS